MDLRLAFLLYVATPLLVLVGAAGSFSLGALEELNEKRLQEDLELIARTLQQPLARAMERDRQGTLETALESAFSFGRVYGAYLYDDGGEQVASAGAAQPSEDKERQELAEQARAGKPAGSYGEVGGRDVYSFFAPVTNDTGQVIGLLEVTRRASDIQAYTNQVRIYGLAGLVGAGLILTLAVFLGYQRAIGRPLEALTASMRRVASGDHDHRTGILGPREIQEQARAFNAMLDRMQRDRLEIQERREHQQRLQRELQQAEKMASIGRLSAGVAHELGTPLSVVDGIAQRVLRDSRLEEDQREQIQRIREQAGRMTQIVEQLLAFGNQPGGQRRPVDVERLTRAAHRSLREVLEEAGTTLEWEISEGPLWAHIDPFRGEQILTHLVGNAVQAAPGGKIAIQWRPLDAWHLELRVGDDGPGIAPEIRERILEPFFTTKPAGQGSGLGLAMVHSMVEEHDGHIAVGESPLGGAEFRIRLPRARRSPEEE